MKLSTAMQMLAALADAHGGDIPDHLLAALEPNKRPAAVVESEKVPRKKDVQFEEIRRKNREIVQRVMYGRK